jgi:hypothetical protein
MQQSTCKKQMQQFHKIMISAWAFHLFYADADMEKGVLQLGWCTISGTIQDIQAKQQQKQEGIIKHERTKAYEALTHEVQSIHCCSPVKNCVCG